MDAPAGDPERTQDNVNGAKLRHCRNFLLKTREEALAVVSLWNLTMDARLRKFLIHHQHLDWIDRAFCLFRH